MRTLISRLNPHGPEFKQNATYHLELARQLKERQRRAAEERAD